MANKYRVSVVHVDDIAAAVRRGIALLGGIERLVRPGAEVVIKVNMFTRATPESAKVTHPAVALEVARLCHEVGAHVSVVERSPHYDFIFRGYEEIEQVARLISLDDAPHRHRFLPGARSLSVQIPWPDLLDACDVFINIPGLRTHALTKYSNGMKNLMGLLPQDTTRYIHEFGLDGSICDINYYRPSDLVVTDAIYTLEGNFPSEGAPVKTDLLTFADNVVAADLVGTEIMDVDPGEVFHLQEAIARGMGPTSRDEIEMVGDDLKELAAGFRITPAPRDPTPYKAKFNLLAEHVCDSCRQALAGGLLAVSHRPGLAEMEGVTIVAGYQDRPPEVGDDKVLVYGNCAYRYRHLGHYEPGCPPLAYQVGKGLAELKTRTIRPAMCSIAWRNEPIERVAPLIAAAGYPGIEAWGPHLDRYVREHGVLAPLAQQFRDLGLQTPMISAYFDLANNLEASLETARRYLGYAADLGAPLIRVFTGGGDSAKASIAMWRSVTAGLKQICQMAAPAHVDLALETHSGHLHDTTDSTLRLIRQVAEPNLGVNLDIFNLFERGEDPLRALKRLLPHMRIVHLKNGIWDGARWQYGQPLSAGAMDYAAFLRALAECNYGGFVSIEWFGDDPQSAANGEMNYLRQQLGRKLEGK